MPSTRSPCPSRPGVPEASSLFSPFLGLFEGVGDAELVHQLSPHRLCRRETPDEIDLGICYDQGRDETEVAVGVPADILRQRPDVRRAERQLAAQTAQIGVATAELYPKFRLSGAIGLDALTFRGLFNSGSVSSSRSLRRFWASGRSSLSWPIRRSPK